MPTATVPLRPPVLSRYDPPTEAEGGIDPLGLQRTYERLAERVLPFVTVRMSRPRFVTAIAVGSHACHDFLDEVARDEVTPGWLAFEWHVVEAFVRRRASIAEGEFWGIPGVMKVEAALKSDRRLSTGTYLKTPKIFGFTGIYRRLATGLESVDDDLRLDEGGFELLRAWEEDQGLDGFLSGRRGPGAEFRDDVRRAVEKAMATGYTAQGSGWPAWERIARHLRPDAPGRREAARILERLRRPDLRHNPDDAHATQMRREFLDHLERHGRPVTRDGEAVYFRELRGRASSELGDRLETIDAYEGLCRIVEDAFRFILHLSTRRGGPVAATDFQWEPLARRLAEQIGPAVDRVKAAFARSTYEADVRELVGRYGGVRSAGSLFETVLRHHEEVQSAKPPEGKRPWFERMPGILARPAYRSAEPPAGGDSYVHDYRSYTASTFLRDLGRLPR